MLLIVGSGLVKQTVETLAVKSGKWKCAGTIAEQYGMQIYQAELLDAEGNVLAVAQQLDTNHNRKCVFRLREPVSGTQAIRIVDGEGNLVYYKDYIAWACAW